MGFLGTLKPSFFQPRDPVAASTPASVPPAKSTEPPRTLAAPARASALKRSRPRKRLLLIGDSAQEREELARAAAPLAADWEMISAIGPAHAAELVTTKSFDGLVLDLRLLVSLGADLVEEATRRSPKLLCFLRYGENDREAIKHGVGTNMHYVSRECDAETFAATVRRAERLQLWTADPHIKQVSAQLRKLPVLPSLYEKAVTELQSATGSLDVVGELIAKDPIMTARMLQSVNSAYFALPRQIGTAGEAVMYLGAERTKSLLLLVGVLGQFDASKCGGFSLDSFWSHGMGVAALARALTMEETKNAKLADLAFTAGLMHDLGKLLLAANLTEQYATVPVIAKQRKLATCDAERDIFGASHAELGAYLLVNWGLPLAILEAVAWHHRPHLSNEREFSPLTAVHVADALENERACGSESANPSPVSRVYLKLLEMEGRMNRWREVAGLEPSSAFESREAQIRERYEARDN
jgi:HD-like signal output (HDOD) protein